MHPRVTPDTVALVRRFEGLRLRAQALPQGGFVIGHGHVTAADPGREITAAEAHALLLFDLSRLAEVIEPQLLAPVTPAQFDALLSFAFGVGVEAFARSTVLKRLNAGAPLDAAAAMELWRCARAAGEPQVVDGLVRRRAVEKARFLEPPEDFAPLPSALLRAEEDAAVLALAEALHDGRRVRRAGLGEREGEPAPSAALAVVAALSARLDQVMRVEPAPERPGPEPDLHAKAEAVPEPEPEPPPLVAAPSPAAPPVAEAAPSAALEESEKPPLVTTDEPIAPLVEPLVARTASRTRAAEPRVSPPSMRAPAFVLGAFGLILFAVAVLKTYQAPSLVWLALGLVAVAAMTPASLHLVGPRRRNEDEG